MGLGSPASRGIASVMAEGCVGRGGGERHTASAGQSHTQGETMLLACRGGPQPWSPKRGPLEVRRLAEKRSAGPMA